jgi:energy-coupling factor transport system ATP-binding protein
VALMGRNGAGKTTLLKNLIGLLPPTRGKVRVADLDARAAGLTEMAQRVGLVPQNPGRLLFNETLEKELSFTCRAHGLPETNLAPLLARLGLSELAHTYPRDLSAGERQRAALAAILIANPQVLLLDEPTRGLDYGSKEKLLAILNDLRQEGVTILLATHDVELVAKCASRILILGDGEIVVDGPTSAVMNDSFVFASQVSKLLRDERYVTVADVMGQLNESENSIG